MAKEYLIPGSGIYQDTNQGFEPIIPGVGVILEQESDSVDNLTATSVITGAPTLGTPTIGQIHVLTATGVTTGNPDIDTPTIGQIHVLTATGVTTGNPDIDTPTIGQIHVLTATGVTTGNPILGTPTLSQLVDLDANDVTTGNPVIGQPLIGQIHTLIAQEVATGNPVVGSPTLGQTHVLTASGIVTGLPVLGSPNTDAADLVAVGIVTGAPVLGTPFYVDVPKPTNIVYKPVISRVFDIKDIVERLDPDRHKPEVVYEFSNGRKFLKRDTGYYEVSLHNGVITHAVVTQVADILQLVEAADPDRHKPVQTYEFSNGRTFSER